MKKMLKMLVFATIVLSLASCAMIDKDNFVYLGHGAGTPSNLLYYDKNKQDFILVDKKNGCFDKDGAGLCLAFNKEQTKNFRDKYLSKMIALNEKMTKVSHSQIVKEAKMMQKGGITTIRKPLDFGNVSAFPIKEVLISNQNRKHIFSHPYQLNADLILLSSMDKNGSPSFDHVYAINSLALEKEYDISAKPYIIDPQYLYTHMTMQAVEKAEKMQKVAFASQAEGTKVSNSMLDKLVDSVNK